MKHDPDKPAEKPSVRRKPDFRIARYSGPHLPVFHTSVRSRSAELRGKRSVLRIEPTAKLGQYLICGSHPLSDGIIFICKHHDTQFLSGNKGNVGCKSIG